MGLVLSPLQLFPLSAYFVLADRVWANYEHLWVTTFCLAADLLNLCTIKIRSLAATYKAPESPSATHTAALVTNASPGSLDASFRPVVAAHLRALKKS
jgi:hypothetical protein